MCGQVKENAGKTLYPDVPHWHDGSVFCFFFLTVAVGSCPAHYLCVYLTKLAMVFFFIVGMVELIICVITKLTMYILTKPTINMV